MKNFACCFLVSFFMCGSTSCHFEKKDISEVDERLASTNALTAFAGVAQDMPMIERQNINTIEALYSFSNPDDQDLDGFESSGSSWNFIDRATSSRFSYLVFSKGDVLAPHESIFIAIPKSLQLDAFRNVRMVLTHDLKIIELSGKEFHQRLAKQFTKISH